MHILSAPTALSLLLVFASAAHASPDLLPLVEAVALTHAGGLPGEVKVKAANQVQKLPDCTSPRAFVPPGSKISGKVLIGVRCEAGLVWTRFVPVLISATVRHAVAQRPLPAGHRLQTNDVQWNSADISRLPRDVVLDEAALAHGVTLQALAAGSPLRGSLIKTHPVILQGQMVKVVASGPGFSLSAEGKAQAPAAPGRSVLVRMPNGQLVSAVAQADGSAEKTP